jgi:diguanylate cyclase (GGDEF)-like protein
MKTENKAHFFHFLVNSMLLLGILLSGIIAFSALLQEHFKTFSSKPFIFALSNTVLLSIIFVAVHFLVKKTTQQTPQKKYRKDELTGLTTRHSFGQIFDHTMLDTKRTLEPLTILLVDIDHFRLINEKHGREIGDKVLFLLGQSVQSAVRASDLTCRWEGDTILIVLKDCTECDGCRLAQKILQKIRQLQVQSSNNQVIPISLSIGVAQMITGDSSQDLIIRAETGLHSARDNGRNIYAIGYEWILIDYACNPII